MQLLKFFLPIFILSYTVGQAQDSTKVKIPKRIYTTKSIGELEKPQIDGFLNEEVWNTVEWSSEYVEFSPDNNTAPTEQTKLKIMYDDKNLYVAFRCYDQDPKGIVKRLSRRDGFEGDWVELNLDSYNDDRSAFSFTITAAGVKGDEFFSNNSNSDPNFNPIWYVKTSIDKEGWVAEMRIPLSQLRFSAEKEQIWGLQSTRRYFRAEERSLWQPVSADAPGWVSEFGELHGLKDLVPQKQIEIQPYILSKAETYPEEPGNPFRDGDDFSLNGGVDGKIGVTNDLTLDFTINPDFGQVEADPAAISLDGFQIFFEEQRPFFVANSNIFDYGLDNFSADNIFYSRRIGRSPQGSAFGPATAFVDQPDNSTIYGAAKFSGKTKNGWSLGVLESVTARGFAKVIDTNGVNTEVLVEPLTNYFVGRVQKDFNNRNSYIGGIFTSTNRDLGDRLDFLRKEAYTAGLDFKHNWKDRTYYLEGNFVTSHVKGSANSIEQTQTSLTHLFNRVDASHVSVDTSKTSLTGTGGKLEIGKASSGNFTGNFGAVWRSPELELNDIGFLRQADEIKQYLNVGYQTLKPIGEFRRITANFRQFSNYDFEGNYNRIQYELRTNAQFKNNWWITIGYFHKPRIFTNTILRGGPRFRFSDENVNFFFIGSDSRKKLYYQVGYVYSKGAQDHFSYLSLEGEITYQPTDALNISLRPNYSKNPNKTQYVSTRTFGQETRYITANIEQQNFSASLRLNYTFTPNLSLQYYAQPFIATGKYSKFNYITNPIAENLNDRYQLYDNSQISKTNTGNYLIDEDRDGNSDYGFGDPDFSFVQFRSNLVLRWEYIPGSEIFLVWSQGVNGAGDPQDHLLTSLNNQIKGNKPENIFLLKATYRFVL